MLMAQHTCQQCTTPFEREARRLGRFCSVECGQDARRVAEQQCKRCGAPFRPDRHSTGRFCSRFCYDADRAILVRSCAHCGKSPLNRGNSRFCSHSCSIEAGRSVHPMACWQCGKEFQPKKSGRKYCSRACTHKAAIVSRPPCRRCGEPVTETDRIYCSRECSAADQAVPLSDCAKCGKALPEYRRRYCSRECAGIAPTDTKPCKVCSKPVRRKSQIYCSKACAWSVRYPTRFCIVCSGALPKSEQNQTCSPECHAIALRRPKNQNYTPEVLASIERMCGEGMTRRAIATHLGMTPGQVRGLITRRGFRLAPAERVQRIADQKPAKPKPVVVRRSGYAPPKPERAPKPTGGPRPITLTDLYRIGGQLYADGQIKRDDRHDVDAVSRAVRREKPDHPGYRVVSPQYFTRYAA